MHYLAYLHRVAEQGGDADPGSVSGQILLQAAQWKILHDQLNSLTTYRFIKTCSQTLCIHDIMFETLVAGLKVNSRIYLWSSTTSMSSLNL